MEQVTAHLVKQARKGDREAFTQLMLANEQMLSRIAMSLLHHPEDAADAVQDTVLEVWQNLEQLKSPRYFKTWLVRVLIHKCYRIGTLRGKHVHVQLEESLDYAQQKDLDQCLDIHAVLEALGESDRLILGLYYYDGFSVKEIASALEVSESCVKQRLHRSRERFKSVYLQKEAFCHEP